MEYIRESNIIQEQELDGQHYFQSFVEKAYQHKLLTDTQMERIQLELIGLMGKVVERYTNDESSSIRTEKAQEILQSILYNLGYYLKANIDVTHKLDIIKGEEISKMYYEGIKIISNRLKDLQKLLLSIQKDAMRLNNIAYQDTIHQGLAVFFHDYNIEFGAHDTPVNIDYPLFTTETELLGIEYMEDYLAKLQLEGQFISCFPTEEINQLLVNFDKQSEHMLINIFELVLINAIGTLLLGYETPGLMITVEEVRWLSETLGSLTEVEQINRLYVTTQELVQKLDLNQELQNYIRLAIHKLDSRMLHNLKTDTLDKFFIPMQAPVSTEYFEDGSPMQDEELRKIIEILRSIDKTDEKMAFVIDNVHSLADFMEVIEESFYEEEYEQILQAMSDTEKELLRRSLLFEYGQEKVEDFEPETEWQKLLFQSK